MSTNRNKPDNAARILRLDKYVVLLLINQVEKTRK